MATSPTITVTVATKQIVCSLDLAIRESVSVTIVNLGGAQVASLVMRIKDKEDNIMAVSGAFSGTTTATGTISLNTTELIAEFAGLPARAVRTFRIGVWESVSEQLLVNDNILLMNNPFTDETGATAANDARYMLRTPGNGSYRVDPANAQHIQLWDSSINLWRTLFISGGALALGPGEA